MKGNTLLQHPCLACNSLGYNQISSLQGQHSSLCTKSTSEKQANKNRIFFFCLNLQLGIKHAVIKHHWHATSFIRNSPKLILERKLVKDLIYLLLSKKKRRRLKQKSMQWCNQILDLYIKTSCAPFSLLWSISAVWRTTLHHAKLSASNQ